MIVTTCRRGGPAEEAKALDLAATWGLVYVPRDRVKPDVPALVVTKRELRLQYGGSSRAWHPGMLHAMRASAPVHPLVRLTGATPGDRVLDCTLGMGTDARFFAWWTGVRVTALECVPGIAAFTAAGLAGVGADVEVIVAEATAWMRTQPNRSFDVVLADPMFPDRETLLDGPRWRRPSEHAAPSLDPIRWTAETRPVDEAWLAEALRLARKAVIVRDVLGNDLLERLGAPIVDQRPKRTTRYGCWRLDDGAPAEGTPANA